MRLKRAALAGLILAATSATAAQAASPELSTSDRLPDRRYVTAAERAQVEGFQDGRFYANGWHITGEMGGIWTPPLKLLDGIWFGIDDQWVGPATKFTSGYGYSRFTLPDTANVKVERTDVAPDGPRAALFGLKLTNPGAARTVTLKVEGKIDCSMQPYRGPDGSITTLNNSVFSTVPGAPAYVAVADHERINIPEHGYQWELENKNAIQSDWKIDYQGE